MNRLSFRTFFFFLILSLVVSAGVRAQRPVALTGANALKKELQAKLDEWHKAGKFPGATLGVVLANGESFGLAVGYSDRDLKTPMKPDDRMLAGSVGGVVTTTTARAGSTRRFPAHGETSWPGSRWAGCW